MSSLPPEPLVALVEKRAAEADLSMQRFCKERLHMDPETFYKWRKGRPVRLDVADTMAIRLGVHPASIWSDWYTLTTPKRWRNVA